MRNNVGNCTSKTFLKGKLLAPKLRKSADKSLSQPGCSHPNTIYNLQLQKTIVLRMQPRHQATLTQPLPCVSQHHVANLHVSTHITTPDENSHAAIPMRPATGDSKTPYNYTHTSRPKAASSHHYTAARKKGKPTAAAGTFHRRLQPLCTEKDKVSCSGFLPKTEPLQHHAAISMRSAIAQIPKNYAHTSTPKAA